MPANAQRQESSTALHSRRFPNESAAYRDARDKLLIAEVALRRDLEEVAAMRRTLPAGGAVAQDYALDEDAGPQGARKEPGQDGRHADLIWPLWNLLDFTPEGRRTDWRPALSYD